MIRHEAVAPFHYILPLLLALRLDDGTVTRKWITRYLLPMLSLFSMALTGYGIYFAVRTNCPTIAITEAPGGTIVAESKGGFDPAIAHLFLGTILYILLGSCFWKRARQWQFGLAQAILLPLFAAVPASKVYAFWLGNLWEVVWSASFVGLEVWLDKKGAEGWICVRRGKEMGLEAEERGVPKPGQDELINGGRDISAITGITVAEREQV